MAGGDLQRAIAQQPSGRYVIVGRGTAAYRAFVPAPLPPDLAYDSELVRALSDADRALGELAGYLRQRFAFPLASWFIDRETLLSARIEGIDVAMRDLHAELGQLFPLPDLRPRPSPAALREVANARAALHAARERLDTLPLSLRLIRETHARLFAGVREEQVTPGEFRRSQNWVGPAGSPLNDATYVPPPPAELAATLDAFEKYLHRDDSHPPLVRLAFIHQQFEAIHPFLDGNGRIGRMLIPLLLGVWNILPQPLLTLSAYFLRHQRRYDGLLLMVNETGEWRDWLRFFLRGVAEESRDVLDRARHLVALHDEWIARADAPRANRSLAAYVHTIFLNPVNSGRRLGGWRKHAERLAGEGFLQQLPDPARRDIFVARAIYRIMDE